MSVKDIKHPRAVRLTVVEGVSVLQSSQLLQAGVQDSRPVTGHRESKRLPVWSYRPHPLLAPVGTRETPLPLCLDGTERNKDTKRHK